MVSVTSDAESAEPAAPEDARPLTVIEPPQRWQLVDWQELWRYRELVFFLCWRDVKVRYKQTAIGVAWAVIQPFMMMVIFTVVFNRVAGLSSGELPYPLFTFAGLLPWFLFSSALAGSANSVVGSERLITKIYFPRLAIPVAAMSVAVVDYLIANTVLAAMMLYYGVAPAVTVWLLPLIAGLILLNAAGLGIFLAALNVRYRDVRHALPFLIQLGMYATPTIYMTVDPRKSGWASWLLSVNPVAGLIQAYRYALFGGEVYWQPIVFGSVIGLSLGALGCWYFKSVEDSFADVI